jgi:hypothetical protein
MPDIAAAKAARKRSPRRYSRAAAISQDSSADRALAGVGVLIALSSLAFAGYMVVDSDGPPRIAGVEYLGIFGRPNHSIAAADRPATIAAGEAQRIAARGVDLTSTGSIPDSSGVSRPVASVVTEAPGVAARSIDPTPTGSIPDRAGVGRPVNLILTPMRASDPPPPSSPYKLLDVLNGEALLQTDVGLRHVKAGDLLPDLGRINAIERRGDHWVLLTQSGAAFEWPPQPQSPAAPSSGKKTLPR